MPRRCFTGNAEPSLEDLLTDDIAYLLRARDGLAMSDVLRVIETTKALRDASCLDD